MVGGLAGAVLVACGDDATSDASGADGEGSGTVVVIEPADGAVVTSPVLFKFQLEGVTAGPAGEVVDDEVHMHIVVNDECVEVGEVIPGPDDTYVHWGDGSLEKEVELPVGQHELCIQGGDGLHVATDVTKTISIEVTE